MLIIKAKDATRKNAGKAASRTAKKHTSKIGLAVAGGGPIGGMYELGALHALAESIEGLDMQALDVYVGVSSGAFLVAGLANGMTTSEMCRIFITGESDRVRFRPEAFLRPALFEYMQRAAGVPRVLLGWLGDLARRPFDISMSDLFMRFGSVLPTGLFDNGAIESFLREMFESYGLSNDFRKLSRPLYIVAAELNSGEAIRFGSTGYDAVPISRAIEASSALPGLYPPVRIDGKYYVDGAMRRTLHASVALDAGADLVLAINPLVPFDAARAQNSGKKVPQDIVAGGLPTVLSQMFRAILQSRLQVGITHYGRAYNKADMVLFEPDSDDVEMFYSNVFSYSNRQRVAESAWHATRADLRERRSELNPLLKRHGMRLREKQLASTQTLVESLATPLRRTDTTARLHRVLDRLDGALDDSGLRKPAAPRRAPKRRVARA